jgi:transcriptional regulator with XRE-family HTH domain
MAAPQGRRDLIHQLLVLRWGHRLAVSTIAAEVGRRIATLRQRLGLSQVAFARQVGTSRNALMTYERGDRVPKSATLARIAEAGGVSVDWLLGRDGGSSNDARAS